MQRIAIIRLSSLGDIVHTLPAFQALRREFPGARITWIAEPAGAAMLRNFPGIDHILVFDLRSRPSLPAKISYLASFVSHWRGQFDLAFDFQGLIKSALLAFMLGGKRWGFGRKNAREPLAALFYSRRAAPFPEYRHVIHKNLHLLCQAGIAATAAEYPQRDWAPSPRLEATLEKEGLGRGDWIVLNVGGGWPSKLLNETQWRQIARGLENEGRIVMLWGNEKERITAEAVARQSRARVAPFMEFADLIFFISRARLVVSGDTLALHLADMLAIPSVGVFGPTSPQRNGPLLPASRTVQRRLACSFCYRRQCDTMACLRDIATEDVIAAARTIDGQRN